MNNYPCGRLGLTIFTCLLGAAKVQADEASPWPQPLDSYAKGENACIAVYDHTAEQLHINDQARCAEPLPPCSTFKIPHALIGLDLGLLSGPDHLKKWDGTEHSRKVQNKDHDLASSIRDSIVWYYQELATEIGPENMQRYLGLFRYGNEDISGGQQVFWLGNSLKISALNQLGFMAALDAQALPVSQLSQQQVKSMMRQDYALPEEFSGELYGKTGSCQMPDGDHGWFAGFYHRDDRRYSFAINLRGEDKWGPVARKLAVRVMQDLR